MVFISHSMDQVQFSRPVSNNNDFELHKMTQSIAIEKATGAKPIRETNSGGTQGLKL